MTKPLDLTGQRFGRLTATECLGTINRARYWAVKCDCGNEEIVCGSHLKSGNTQSCGCLRVEAAREVGKNKLTHGGSRNYKRTIENQAWHVMRKRHPIVPEWNDFQQFFKDIGWRPSTDHYLARHNRQEPHGPTNTYWRNKDDDRRLRNLTHSDLGDEFFIDMRAISRANYAAKERERATSGVPR